MADFADPNTLRSAIFAAIAARDGATLTTLVNDHCATILALFASWTKVPVEVRSDPAALQVYANGLIVLADTFAKGGHPQLMELLRGGGSRGGGNPIERWQSAFRDADAHAQAGRHRDAIAILVGMLGEFAGSTGTAIDD